MSHLTPFKEIVIRGEKVLLLPEKALYLVKQKTLVVADLHLGKANHFRKNGIYVPLFEEITSLINLTNYWKPDQIIFLGDLFHSIENGSIANFLDWSICQACRKILVRGNHDLLPISIYSKMQIECVEELSLEPFLFLHEYTHPSNSFVVSGHIHPSITLVGKGKQGVKLSTFVLKEDNMILPAFGCFTGTYSLPMEKDTIFYAITDSKIFTINSEEK